MNWFLLIVLVPLVLVPVVLLCGFAGCAEIAGISDEPGTPPAPTLVTAKALGTTQVRVDWKSIAGSTFVVERALGSGSFLTVKSGVAPSAFDDDQTTGLVEGTTFRYRVRATQGGGLSPPSSLVRVTTLPNPPTDLATTFAGPGRVVIQWVNRSAEADLFRVERRSPPNVGQFTPLATPVAGPTFQDTEAARLTAGSQHEYRVVAIVSNGFDNNATKDVESEPSVALLVSIA